MGQRSRPKLAESGVRGGDSYRGADPVMTKFHKTYIFVFGRDVGTDFSKIKNGEPCAYFVTAITEP